MNRRNESGRKQRLDRHFLSDSSTDDLKNYQECARKLDECSKNLLRLCQALSNFRNFHHEEIDRAADDDFRKSEEDEARKIAAELVKQRGALAKGPRPAEIASSTLNLPEAVGKLTDQTAMKSAPFSDFYCEDIVAGETSVRNNAANTIINNSPCKTPQHQTISMASANTPVHILITTTSNGHSTSAEANQQKRVDCSTSSTAFLGPDDATRFFNCFLQSWREMSKVTFRNSNNKPLQETQCNTLPESTHHNSNRSPLSPKECLQRIICALNKTNLDANHGELTSNRNNVENGLMKTNETFGKKRDGNTVKTFCQPVKGFSRDKTNVGMGNNFKNRNSSRVATCGQFLRHQNTESQFALDSTLSGAYDPFLKNATVQSKLRRCSSPRKDDPCESYSQKIPAGACSPNLQSGRSRIAVDENGDGGSGMDSSILLAIAKAAIELSLEQQKRVGVESECDSEFAELIKAIFDDDPC